ncbi:holo-ACP synthase [Brevibacterium linens]|uniref:Holo-[acyl-carrier-protein] synthase n=1 Tax=Brevibacterium linens ATCC 9172 TaxID=1255617 RepID=A0A2H1IGX7_BRELN|nr:holo-ACP synthase [Brevibacterium linens]KAB1948490.1 holo-ACP synthase [Brevibacterium linens ATCC 9172]SMX74438.1 holo-[acyl-carrier protein] synthase [Brevibacterium linens ATCC 9172]
MAILGIGTDIADVPRFAEHIERVPELLDRLLTPGEQLKRNGKRRTDASLAARFSAKEALKKAIGFPGWLPWQSAEVVPARSGAPSFRLRGLVLEHFRAIGGTNIHLSITHDAHLTMTFVIAEGDGPSLSRGIEGAAEHFTHSMYGKVSRLGERPEQ